jgi:uncharacterized protein YdeI (YjbR/CyaY-like superfamily)
VVEEPEDEEENELGFAIEVWMEEVKAGVDDRIDEEQRFLSPEERQMEDHRMKNLEELEIERREVEVGLNEREKAHEDGEFIKNKERSEINVVENPADDEMDENLDLSDFIA